MANHKTNKETTAMDELTCLNLSMPMLASLGMFLPAITEYFTHSYVVNSYIDFISRIIVK